MGIDFSLLASQLGEIKIKEMSKNYVIFMLLSNQGELIFKTKVYGWGKFYFGDFRDIL